jgi:hypothetical protein
MLGLSGLSGRESGGERLVGKDYAVAVGLRVVFSKRYEGDAWARDESAGRAGTVVELLEPYTHEGRVQHAACRWAHCHVHAVQKSVVFSLLESRR